MFPPKVPRFTTIPPPTGLLALGKVPLTTIVPLPSFVINLLFSFSPLSNVRLLPAATFAIVLEARFTAASSSCAPSLTSILALVCARASSSTLLGPAIV